MPPEKKLPETPLFLDAPENGFDGGAAVAVGFPALLVQQLAFHELFRRQVEFLDRLISKGI